MADAPHFASDSSPVELGIIGAGNMAEAIVRGVLAKGVLRPEQILAADVSPQRREVFEKELGVRAAADNTDVARRGRNLLLSVKPQQMKDALADLGAAIASAASGGKGPAEGRRVISIAAGISTHFIEQHLGGGLPWRVVRTMPNTPMLVGEGVVAMAAGRYATTDDLAATRRLFEAAATVLEVTEDKIDAVTAVSGSGPAYFYFVEQMVRAGVELGLTAEQAHDLAVRTCLGAGKMLASSSDSPRELRRKVTSPKGTTEAAITAMEAAEVGRRFGEAIHAAARRSRELGM